VFSPDGNARTLRQALRLALEGDGQLVDAA
jgi:hypothetical protein